MLPTAALGEGRPVAICVLLLPMREDAPSRVGLPLGDRLPVSRTPKVFARSTPADFGPSVPVKMSTRRPELQSEQQTPSGHNCWYRSTSQNSSTAYFDFRIQ